MVTYRGSGALGVCVGEEARARNLVFFHGKWLQPAMKVTSCVRRVRVRSFRCVIGSPLVCVLQRVVAHVCVVIGCFGTCACRSPCNGCMMLSRFVAMCVETCGLDTWCCKTHRNAAWMRTCHCKRQCNGCMKVSRCGGCARNTIVFCSWASHIVLEWLHQGYDTYLSADFSIWCWWFSFIISF